MEPGHAAGLDVEVSDGDLARRVASGDRTAEEELCRRFRPRARLFGLRHLRDDAAAADLAQDALVAVLARLRDGGVQNPDSIASFVLSTCRQLVESALRTRRRREAILAAEPPPSPHGAPADPLPRDRLTRCLQALASRERTIVLATFYAEQATEEISREHGLTAGNVRVLRHRALQRLRSCLGIEEAA